MNTPDKEKELNEAEAELHALEQLLGPDSIEVAHRLEFSAALFRKYNTRLLDAANMEARAKVITTKLVKADPNADRRLGDSLPIALLKAGQLTEHGDYKEAEKLYRETIALSLASNEVDYAVIATLLRNLGNHCFKPLGKTTEASHLLRLAFSLEQGTNEVKPYWIARIKRYFDIKSKTGGTSCSLGWFLLISGLLWAFYLYFIFDATVATTGAERIYNLGLLSDRQNGMVLSLGLAVLGILTIFLGPKEK